MIKIDLGTSQGNAFFILGAVRELFSECKRHGLSVISSKTGEDLNQDTFMTDMKAGDYIHLLKTVKDHLAEYIEFIDPDNLLLEESDDDCEDCGSCGTDCFCVPDEELQDDDEEE